jgi:spore maturation protein CgeB
MRIFCAVQHSNDPKFFYGGLWSGNFYPALRELGHEIIESQTDLLPTSCFMHIADGFTHEEVEARAQTTERILDEVRTAQQQGIVNLFLSYFYNSHFDPAGFDELRRLGIPSVNFYCNSIHQFAQVAAIAAKVDFSWHAERDARDAYLSVGANPVWVQMGADPNIYFPVHGRVRQHKSVFVGQRYADRDRWIAALIQARVPIEIYGSGWGAEQSQSNGSAFKATSYLGRKVPAPSSLASYVDLIAGEFRRSRLANGFRRLKQQAVYRRETRAISEMLRPYVKGRASDVATVFAGYELCMNFSNVWADGRPGSMLIPHIRLRDFEAPMCRTCYLTGHSEEITDFYEVGREVETYCTKSELIDKARFYLKHPDSAERLREAGYQRARRDHTWVQRFRQLFRKVGLSKNV